MSIKAPLIKGGWRDSSQAAKDAVHRSKSPLSPPLLRGETVYFRSISLCLLTFLLLLTSSATAQSSLRGEVRLEIGFNGEIVADHWNPLRLQTRDVPSATLELTLDQSTLLEGEKLAVYRAEITGGNGVAVFEDDVYLPTWRRFVWRLYTPDEVLASGSFDRRRSNNAPLTLLVSADPFRWRGVLETRATDVPTNLLPRRLAAYDGVERVLIDGSAPAPDASVLAAASAAGAVVTLVEPLPQSHAQVSALTGTAPTRLGAGWVTRTTAEDVATTPEAEPVKVLTEALVTEDLAHSTAVRRPLPLLIVASVYLLSVLLFIRLAGAPGLLTGLALALLLSFAAWFTLRPATSQVIRGRTLVIGGGTLARQGEVRTLFTLPDFTLSLPVPAHPNGPVAFEQAGETFNIDLGRWSGVQVETRPSLLNAVLQWREGDLVNTGTSGLQDVYVKGLGFQPDLLADERRAVSDDGKGGPLPEVYEQLLVLVPEGSALARAGGTFHLALPLTPSPEASLGERP